MDLLERRGALVSFHDPFVAEIPPTREHAQYAGRRSLALTAAAAASFDAAIICADHDPVDYRLVAEHAPLIIDTRNACARRGLAGDRVVKA
jgi:UDP-N-acetyl-D-glucosamine dehydrogenase